MAEAVRDRILTLSSPRQIPRALVDKVVPAVLWEVQCHDPVSDCSYSYAPISWSNDPDDWESARAALAHIIDGQ